MLTVNNFKLPETPKVVLISHNDLDGAGPVLICDRVFEDLKYFNVSNNSVDKMVDNTVIKGYNKGTNLVLITDCSIVSKELADKISEVNKKGDMMVYLFDHHGTALWLNDYDWAIVSDEVDSDGDPCVSGTLLFFNFMYEAGHLNNLFQADIELLAKISQTISNWDTWQWVKKQDVEPKQLEQVYRNTGVQYLLAKFKKSDELLNDMDYALLSDLDNKFKFIELPGIKRTIVDMEVTLPVVNDNIEVDMEAKLPTIEHQLTVVNTIDRKVRFVATGNAPGDLAEMLYEDGIDIVFIFYPTGTVSMRTRLEDINLGNLAKYWANGGGHSKSAGFTLNETTMPLYLNYISKRFNLKEEI